MQNLYDGIPPMQCVEYSSCKRRLKYAFTNVPNHSGCADSTLRSISYLLQRAVRETCRANELALAIFLQYSSILQEQLQ